MKKIEVVHTQTGSGILELKGGKSGRVMWTLEFLDNGEVGRGQIKGSQKLIRLAVRDKLAKMIISPDFLVAVAVGSCRAGKALIRGLLTSRRNHTHPCFEAESLAEIHLAPDGDRVFFEFFAASGEQQVVIVPLIAIRSALPLLQKVAASPEPHSSTSPHCRFPKRWSTGSSLVPPIVALRCDDDPPLAFSTETARRLATELIERSMEIERRLGTRH